jgi:hypothetical protein
MIVTLTIIGWIIWFFYVLTRAYGELVDRKPIVQADMWRWRECSHGIEHLVAIPAGETHEYAWETQTLACLAMARADKSGMVPCMLVYWGEEEAEVGMVLCLQ